MNNQPLTPGLPYPVLPVQITHGVATDGSARAFAPVAATASGIAGDADGFVPVGFGP
jgi:hypothetical protein